jgi:hypothetical protein
MQNSVLIIPPCPSTLLKNDQYKLREHLSLIISWDNHYHWPVKKQFSCFFIVFFFVRMKQFIAQGEGKFPFSAALGGVVP